MGGGTKGIGAGLHAVLAEFFSAGSSPTTMLRMVPRPHEGADCRH
jgi:hypothetical protein